jgi:hypothetical protein
MSDPYTDVYGDLYGEGSGDIGNVIQFVDAISGSPTVRLDLNQTAASSNAFAVDVEGMDLSPPPMRRSVFNSMLADGDHIGAAAFENRVLKIPIRIIRAASTDTAATMVQTLARELNRATNLLKVQFDGATAPVFFRTYRAPDYTLSMLRFLIASTSLVTLEIPAEPYALGLEESLGSITVNNDPAAGTNPLYFDVSAANCKGDVPTPLYMKTTSSLAGASVIIATRRRGTPANGTFFVQAENATNGTDTADQADANASGGNEVRTTFATTGNGYADRLTATVPSGTASVEHRGTYRVLVRHQRSATGSVINSKLNFAGTTSIGNPIFTLPDSTTYQLVDYGLLQIPFGSKAEQDGYGAALGAGGVNITLRIQRFTGTASLDTDYILLVPADTEFAWVTWPALPAGPEWVFDGPNDDVYWRSTSGSNHAVSATSGEFPSYVGGLPMISPNQISRVFFIRAADAITASTVLQVSYMPRYLTVRPAST